MIPEAQIKKYAAIEHDYAIRRAIAYLEHAARERIAAGEADDGGIGKIIADLKACIFKQI